VHPSASTEAIKQRFEMFALQRSFKIVKNKASLIKVEKLDREGRKVYLVMKIGFDKGQRRVVQGESPRE